MSKSKLKSAALGDEAAENDLSIPGEAGPPAVEPPTNGHANTDGDAFHVRLDKALNAAIALCATGENWPEMSVKERNTRERLVKELAAVGHALVSMATPTASSRRS